MEEDGLRASAANKLHQIEDLLKQWRKQDPSVKQVSHSLFTHYHSLIQSANGEEQSHLIKDLLWNAQNIIKTRGDEPLPPAIYGYCDACLTPLLDNWYHCNACKDNYDECDECHMKKHEEDVRHPHIDFMQKLGFAFEPELKSEQDNILSFDGGGIRGYLTMLMFEKYCRAALDKLENEDPSRMIEQDQKTLASFRESYKAVQDSGISYFDYWVQYLIRKKFHLICGTSIGGIIAIMFAVEIPLSAIKALFEDRGSEIFEKEWFFKVGCATYKNDGLRKLYNEVVKKYWKGDKKFKENPELLTFGDLTLPCAVTTYNLQTSNVVWFSNQIRESFEIKLVDAVLSTSAAPTYFPVHKFYAGEHYYECVDGGIWANDPRLFALFSERIVHAHEKKRTYNIISFGTGEALNAPGDGFFNQGDSTLGWLARTPNIIEVIFDGSTAMTKRMFTFFSATGLVRSERMQLKLDVHVGLDDVKSIEKQRQLVEAQWNDGSLKKSVDGAVRMTWLMGVRTGPWTVIKMKKYT